MSDESQQVDFIPFPETGLELLLALEEMDFLDSFQTAIVAGDYPQAHTVAGQVGIVRQLRAWYEETQEIILNQSLADTSKSRH